MAALPAACQSTPVIDDADYDRSPPAHHQPKRRNQPALDRVVTDRRPQDRQDLTP